MAVGMQTSTVRVSTLNKQKLRAMKPADDLELIDKESGK